MDEGGENPPKPWRRLDKAMANSADTMAFKPSSASFKAIGSLSRGFYCKVLARKSDQDNSAQDNPGFSD